ncbi:glycosyl hydrolase, partial [Streptomyces chartreusis]
MTPVRSFRRPSPPTIGRSAAAIVLALVAGIASPPASAAGTVTAAATVCNKYCDTRDPALSPGDRTPVTIT